MFPSDVLLHIAPLWFVAPRGSPIHETLLFGTIKLMQNMLALVILILVLDALLPGLKGDQFYGHGETENEGGAVGKTFHTIILGTASLCL